MSSKVDTSILLGDFNHGPAVATSPGASEIGWSKPFHYGLVAARGFISPYLLYDGRCTFCSENPGTSFFSPPETSFIFDHIYIPTSAFFRLLSVRVCVDEFGVVIQCMIRELNINILFYLLFFHVHVFYSDSGMTSQLQVGFPFPITMVSR